MDNNNYDNRIDNDNDNSNCRNITIHNKNHINNNN